MRLLLSVLIILIPFQILASPPNKTSMGPEPTVTGKEVWQINGKAYEIEGTILVRVKPYPNHLFAVKVIISEDPGKQHESLAREIAKYALENGYYEEAQKMAYKGKPVSLVPKIGVAVIKKQGFIFAGSGKGYRFQFNLSGLKEDSKN